MSIFSFLRRNKNDKTISTFSEEEADFVRSRQKEGIGIKTALMEYAAIKKGLKVERLSKRIILVDCNGSKIGFHNMNGNFSSRVGLYLCNGKFETRKLLRDAGLSVVESEIFLSTEFDRAVNYVKKINFPVVVKPTNLSRGRGITTNIQNMNDLSEAWEYGLNAYKRKRSSNKLIIERHVTGEDYRFFVVGKKVISATHRKRANVLGDGKSTIIELIEEKNNIRANNPYLSSYLIPEDIEQLDMLSKQGMTLETIPGKGQEVILRSQSNISAGGDSIDVTEKVHKEFNEIAIKAVEAVPGIEYAGVDIITPDITVKPNASNHIVSEVEYSPAPITHFPSEGKRRDMVGAILDFYIENTSNN